MPATPGKKRAFKVASVLLAISFGLSASELLLLGLGRRARVQVPGPTLPAYFWIRDARLGFRNRPSSRLEHALAGSVVSTGPRGERCGVGSPASGTGPGPIVLFVGDSTTFCGEVNDDETGPSEV